MAQHDRFLLGRRRRIRRRNGSQCRHRGLVESHRRIGRCRRHDHQGTFWCNGRYIWGASSNGGGENPLGAQVLDVRDRDFRAIAGSADMYVFRARNPDPAAPELECWFVPCYCSGCREAGSTIQGPADAESCVYRCITRAPVWPFCGELHVPGRRHVPARRAARRRRWDDSDDDSD